MNWPPSKSFTSTRNRMGFRHFVAINYGGQGKNRWIQLIAVLDGKAKVKVKAKV